MRKQMFVLFVVLWVLVHSNVALAQSQPEPRDPDCPVGVPYMAKDCYPVERLKARLSVSGSGIDSIVVSWVRIKTARSYVLEELVQGRWRIVAQLGPRATQYRRIVGCGVVRSFRMYAKDGFYRSEYSQVVTGNSFACK